MARFLVYSDLHYEIGGRFVPPAHLRGTVVILAGDIAEGRDAMRHARQIGISLPGMPSGVPGMEGARSEPLSVYEIASGDAAPRVFVTIP